MEYLLQVYLTAPRLSWEPNSPDFILSPGLSLQGDQSHTEFWLKPSTGLKIHKSHYPSFAIIEPAVKIHCGFICITVCLSVCQSMRNSPDSPDMSSKFWKCPAKVFDHTLPAVWNVRLGTGGLLDKMSGEAQMNFAYSGLWKKVKREKCQHQVATLTVSLRQCAAANLKMWDVELGKTPPTFHSWADSINSGAGHGCKEGTGFHDYVEPLQKDFIPNSNFFPPSWSFIRMQTLDLDWGYLIRPISVIALLGWDTLSTVFGL